MRIEEQTWNTERILAEDTRRQSLFEETLTRPAFAKDVRLFNLHPLLRARWQHLVDECYRRVNDVRTRGIRQTLAWSLLSGLGGGIPIVYVINGVESGEFSVGDLVLYIGLIAQAQHAFVILTFACTEVAGATLGIAQYEEFVNEEAGAATHGLRTDIPPLARAITLDQVGFRYPGATTDALTGVSLRVAHGEVVAIVGHNGAGKSTLAKLLAKLYDPTSGSIRWDDIDLATVDHGAWRERIAVMSQDPAEFPFSLRDNLAFGRLHDPPDDAELLGALMTVGLDDLQTRADDPLDLPLTKELKDGTQLSGGQWQRIAMARAMLRARTADLLLLDEPTASLDPATEYAVIDRILAMAAGKTAIVITHRLAICTQVDRVLVIERGRLIEAGTHAELIENGGRYAEMFAKQAERHQRAVTTVASLDED